MPPFPYDQQFRKLMRLGRTAEGEELFAELLRSGTVIRDPLIAFLKANWNDPKVAILIELLAKSLGSGARWTLIGFLINEHPELRRAACTGLGWIRCRESLGTLDKMESEDSDPTVRAEARAAIDEILRDWPGLAGTLQNHEITTGISGARVGPRLSLVLPRLLAVRLQVAPLGLTSEGKLRIAVPLGMERRLLAPVEVLTGREVVLEPIEADAVRAAIEKTYHYGDDDFLDAALEQARQSPPTLSEALSAPPDYLAASLFGALTVTAVEGLSEEIRAGIRLNEPCCPFDEASDAVEAFQSLVAQAWQSSKSEATLSMQSDSLHVGLNPPRGDVDLVPVGERPLGEKIFALLSFLLLASSEGDLSDFPMKGVVCVGSGDQQTNVEITVDLDPTRAPVGRLRFTS